MSNTPALEIDALHLSYETARGKAAALTDITLRLDAMESVGVVGESGCGKSTLLKAIMGVMATNARIESGEIRFQGTNLLAGGAEAWRRTRWSGISIIPQSALNALDPVQRVGAQIAEAILAHRRMSKADIRKRIEALFELVGVDRARIDSYPHQLSGGMRQRVLIAMALVLEPPVVLADEPTTALDVIVQSQIFSRMRELRQSLGFALMLVTHDIAVVVENCDRIIVMYGGMVVESGPTREVMRSPSHPYTLGLRAALPEIGMQHDPIAISGRPPDLVVPPPGCRFAPRCPFRLAICDTEMPRLTVPSTGREVRCHRWREMDELAPLAQSADIWSAVAEPA